MKTFILFLFLGLSQVISAQKNSSVSITIENIANQKGKLLVGLYKKGSFLKAKPEFGESLSITGKKVQVTFKNVPQGTYAISTYHDENENHQLDMDSSGKPTEAYGISNNPQLTGWPQWENAKFKVDKKLVKKTIQLVH